MFYIQRTILCQPGVRLGVTADEDRKHIQLMTWKPTYHDRCEWIGCALTPHRALQVANLLADPPPWEPVKVGDGTTPLRQIWQVLRVKHDNGVFVSSIGIARCTAKGLTSQLGICESQSDSHQTRKAQWWYPSNMVTLKPPQARILQGLLYAWAGLQMVGTREDITPATTRSIPHLEDLIPRDYPL